MPTDLRLKLDAAAAAINEAIGLLPAELPPPPRPPPVAVPPSTGAIKTAETGLRIQEADLKPQSSMPTLRAGMTLDGYRIAPQLTVNVPDVTFRNCLIEGRDIAYTSGAGVRSQATGLRFEHCEMRGGFHSAVAFDRYTAWRCNVHHFGADGFKLGTGSHIIECWIHDATPAPGSHADGVQQQDIIGPPGASVVRCHIEMGPRIGNAAIFLKPDFAGTGGGVVLIEDNYLAGGNYTLQVQDGGALQQLTYRVHGNVIKDAAWRYGPVVRKDPVAEWSNNRLASGATV